MDRDEQPCLFASDILYMSDRRITLDTLLAHSASPYPLLAYPIPRASKHATANNCPVIPTDASRINNNNDNNNKLADQVCWNQRNQAFISATLRSDSAVQCHLTAWLFCEGGGVRFIPAWFFVLFLYCIAYFFHSLGIEYRGQKNYYNNSNNVVRGFNASRISDFLYAVLSSSSTASVGVLMSRWLQFRRRYRQSCKTINFLFNFFNYFVPLLFVAFPSFYTAKRVLWKTSKPINKEKQNITIARTNRKKHGLDMWLNWQTITTILRCVQDFSGL